jgi:putative transposase
MDWFTRCVLAWELSNTMDVNFCVAALEQALSPGQTPEIFNTDQGSQFTYEAFAGTRSGAGIAELHAASCFFPPGIAELHAAVFSFL